MKGPFLEREEHGTVSIRSSSFWKDPYALLHNQIADMSTLHTWFFFICFTALSKVFKADARFARSMNTVPLRATIHVNLMSKGNLLNHPKNGAYFNIFFAVTAQCFGNACASIHANACDNTLPNMRTSNSLQVSTLSVPPKPLMITYEHSRSSFSQNFLSLNIPFQPDQTSCKQCKRPPSRPLCKRRPPNDS